MKVLMLNGSSRQNGCTFTALKEVGETLRKYGIEYEIFQLGSVPIRDCVGCGNCKKNGKCIFKEDLVNEFIEKAYDADGFVFGSPVYFAHPSGRILSFLDRAFFADGATGRKAFRFKPAAAVVSARRGGTVASFDVLNKYFSLSNMPVVSSSYWNMVYGQTPKDVMQDKEGLQIMRNVGHNMAWLMKCIEYGNRHNLSLLAIETKEKTNFIR